jgi:hypothetical protein
MPLEVSSIGSERKAYFPIRLRFFDPGGRTRLSSRPRRVDAQDARAILNQRVSSEEKKLEVLDRFIEGVVSRSRSEAKSPTYIGWSRNFGLATAR